MNGVIKMQSEACSKRNLAKICAFDRESVSAPTEPILYQGARFLLITKGKGAIRVRDKGYELRPDTLVSILPWEIAEITAVQSPLHYLVIRYRFRIINDILKTDLNIDNEPLEFQHVISEHPVVYCQGRELEEIQRIFAAIEEELGQDATMGNQEARPLSTISAINLLVELLVAYIRLLWSGTQPMSEKQKYEYSEIFQYIATHLSEKITLKKLSSLFGLSEAAISAYIRQTVGLSLSDLLNEMRVVTTVSYLLYTDLTLEEISDILGFVDSSHLSKVFAARMGAKVNQYRKTYSTVNEICKIRDSRQSVDIVGYIYRNYSEPIDAKIVADKFGMTVNELNQILMYQVEKNFAVFLNSVRVKKACELLLSTEDSVIKIALDVGYRTIKTFNRQFLRIMGTSPGSFRKANRLSQGDLVD